MFDLTIHRFGELNGCGVYMLREDLLPVACGGNKVRIAAKLLEDAKRVGATVVVGYGNSRSNLCRVLAMMCAASGLGCVIVSPSDDDGGVVDTANGRIAALCGASVVRCDKRSNIARVVSGTLDALRSGGERPYYIFGSEFGTGNEKTLSSAYEEVALQILRWEEGNGIKFDRVALAVGTGSTYAGLLNGFRAAGSGVDVLGYTIARDVPRCVSALKAFTGHDVNISAVALNGGYGRSSPEEDAFLAEIVRSKSILFDSTYAGKALWGLSREAHAGETILFVHTGSLPLAIDGLYDAG